MADEPNKGSEDPNKINNQENVTGADPTKKPSSDKNTDKDKKEDGEKPFDESVFDNPKLWSHPRFKSLNERAKLADQLEKEKSQAEEQRLAEAKKFEELANKRAQERDDVKSKYTQSLQDNRIIVEATKIGVVDIEAVLRLVDRTNISIDDNGNVIGAVEAVTTLLESKQYLKGKADAKPIGSPTSPSDDTNSGAKKFKLSQIQDAQFYKDHEADILQAYKLGLIEDDTKH